MYLPRSQSSLSQLLKRTRKPHLKKKLWWLLSSLLIFCLWFTTDDVIGRYLKAAAATVVHHSRSGAEAGRSSDESFEASQHSFGNFNFIDLLWVFVLVAHKTKLVKVATYGDNFALYQCDNRDVFANYELIKHDLPQTAWLSIFLGKSVSPSWRTSERCKKRKA